MPRFFVEPGVRSWSDAIAVTASTACLIHCLVLPILIAAVPAAARFIDVPDTFHLFAVGLSVPASAWAMVTGYRRHGAMYPGMLAATGVGLLLTGALSGLDLFWETSLTVFGSFILVGGHLSNWRLRVIGVRSSHTLKWDWRGGTN